MELLARVRAIMRRSEIARRSNDRLDRIEVGCLEIDPHTRSATVRRRAVELTAKEFELLHHFARQPGRVFRRIELLDSVWGYGHEGYEHTVNSHINRLRSKIESNPARPELIVTVWGVGYKLNAESSPKLEA